MELSKAEWAGIVITAAILAFSGGWLARGSVTQGYTVSQAHPEAEPSTLPPQSFAPESQVELNEATLDDLMGLPGIGETKAQAILDYRDAHGGFRYLEELTLVDGIGQSTFEKLEPYITLKEVPHENTGG